MAIARQYESQCIGVDKAVEYYGTHKLFAQALGVHISCVGKWRRGELRMSLERALKIEKLTKGIVKASDFIIKKRH